MNHATLFSAIGLIASLISASANAFYNFQIDRISGLVCETTLGQDVHAIDRSIRGTFNGPSVREGQYSADWGHDYVQVVCPLDDIRSKSPVSINVNVHIADRTTKSRYLNCGVYVLSPYDGRLLDSHRSSVKGTGDKVISLSIDRYHNVDRVVACTINGSSTVRGFTIMYQPQD